MSVTSAQTVQDVLSVAAGCEKVDLVQDDHQLGGTPGKFAVQFVNAEPSCVVSCQVTENPVRCVGEAAIHILDGRLDSNSQVVHQILQQHGLAASSGSINVQIERNLQVIEFNDAIHDCFEFLAHEDFFRKVIKVENAGVLDVLEALFKGLSRRFEIFVQVHLVFLRTHNAYTAAVS